MFWDMVHVDPWQYKEQTSASMTWERVCPWIRKRAGDISGIALRYVAGTKFCMHTEQIDGCLCTLGNKTALCMRLRGTVPLLTCRLSNTKDDWRQCVPEAGVAGLLDRLTNLKDLNLQLHKRAEVGPAGPRLWSRLCRKVELPHAVWQGACHGARWVVLYRVHS